MGAALSFRTFNSPGGQTTNGVNYLLDVASGVFRPAYTTDFAANVNVSGLNLTVGAVNLTGVNIVTLTGNTPVSVTNTAPIAISGIVQTVVTGVINSTVTVGAVAITGTNSGSALGSLDVSHTYLGISGVNTLNVLPLGGFIGITGTVNTNASVTVGAVAITGTNSGSALGSLDLSRTYIAVSGVQPFLVQPIWTGAPNVTANVTTSNTDVVNALTSGNARLLVDNILLSGISGQLASNLSAPAFVTGDGYLAVTVTGNPGVVNIGGYVGVTGTHAVSGSNLGSLDLSRTYLAVSGIQPFLVQPIWTGAPTVTVGNTVTIGNVAVTGGSIQTIVTGSVSTTIANPIGVSGVAIDKALPTINGFATQFLPIGGRVVTATGGGSITGYNATGDMAMLNINQGNGGLFVNQGVLDKTQDEVVVWAASSGTVSNNAVSGISNIGWGVALPNNPNRRAWFIQNLSTGTMWIKFGTAPTSGSLNIILKGGTTQNDGLGASWSDSPAVYTGPVSVSGSSAITPTYISWEL